MPNGRKLKCSKCQTIFFQPPPATEHITDGMPALPGKTMPPPAQPAQTAPPPPPSPAAPVAKEDSRFNLEDLASETAMGDLFKDMEGMDQESGFLQETTPPEPDEEPQSASAMDETFNFEEALADLMDNPADETLAARPKPADNRADKRPAMSGPADSLAEETIIRGQPPLGDDWETPDHQLKEINLDDETLLGAKSREEEEEEYGDEEDIADMPTTLGPGRKRLSDDEEDALGSLGFKAGLNRAEEDALGSLGFHGSSREFDDEEPYFDEDSPPQRKAAAHRAPAHDEEEEEPYLEETPPSKKARSFSFNPPPILAWGVVILLVLTLAGYWVMYQTGFKDWVTFKSFDIASPFRLVSVEGEWREEGYGSMLIVKGVLLNTTSQGQTPPVVKISLLNDENKTLTSTEVIPGRVLTDPDLASNESTLRTLVAMQGDTSRIPPKKAPAKKDVPYQAIFINPPEGAVRFQVDLEPPPESKPGEVKKEPVEKTPAEAKPAEKP